MRNGAGRKRESCRKVKRRAVFFELHAEHPDAADSPLRKTKTTMTQEEAAVLFKAIDNHQLSRFGIVKLAGIDLDAEYEMGWGKTTLLAYAVNAGAHTVTSQLLRAGADATRCLLTPDSPSSLPASLSSRVRFQLMALQSCHRVLLTNLFVAFALQYRLHCSSEQQATEQEQGSAEAAMMCSCGCGMAAQLLTLPCRHRLNTRCYWEQALRCTARGTHCDVTCCCSGCRAVWDLPGEPGSPTVVRLVTLEGLCSSKTAAEVAAQSRSKWLALPFSALDAASAAAGNDKRKGKVKLRNQRKETGQYELAGGQRNYSFRLNVATPLVAACFMLCETQSQRSQELHHAACIGYTQRVLELVGAGAEVDCCNDCGVSALSAAVFHGHIRTAHVLLRSGARADLVDRLGVTAHDIARASQDMRMQRLLAAFAPALCGEEGGHGPPPRQWYALGEGWTANGQIVSLREEQAEQADADAQEMDSAAAVPWHGKDGFVLDGAFSEEYLQHLEHLFTFNLKDHIQLSCRGNSANDDNTFKCPLPAQEEKEGSTTAEKDKDQAACSDRALFADTTGSHAVRILSEVLRHYRHQVPNAVVPCRSVLPAMRFLRYQEDGGSSPPHVDLTKTAGTRSYPWHGEESSEPKVDAIVADVEKESWEREEGEGEGEGEGEEEKEGGAVQVPLQRSSHTFILYLTTCAEGGETALLRQVPSRFVAKKVRGQTGKEEEAGVATEEEGQEGAKAGVETDEVYDEVANTIVAVQPIRGRLLFFPHNHPHEGRPVVVPVGSGKQKLLLRGEMF